MRASKQRIIAMDKEVDGVEKTMFWTTCGWTFDRDNAQLYDKGTGETVIHQMREDEIWSYLV